jgi:hypothetical protein
MRRALVLISALAVLPAAAPAAHAGLPCDVSLGVLTGSTAPDHALADYQWDVTPHAAWGAQAIASLGPLEAGVRGWSTSTTQATGLAGTPPVSVRETSFEMIGRRRLAGLAGVQWLAVASTGWLHLGYTPDRLMVATGGAQPPIAVTLAPVDTWIAGAGLGARRRIGAWGFGLEVERRFFAFDTAHRSGTTVVERRESFGDWSARLELARYFVRS